MRFDKLDLNLLVALDCLLEERNVSVAARSLNLSQSAVSGCLARLREFFGDELLIPHGRSMTLTSRAKQLGAPVRAALTLIRSTITTPAQFDPRTSDRHFTLVASDYVHIVLLSDFMRKLVRDAPGVTLRILQPSLMAGQMFERGEVDLSICVDSHVAEGHPARLLFQDEPCVICWDENPLVGARLDQRQFLSLGHVIADFGSERPISHYETRLSELRALNRRVEVTVSAFSLMPSTIVGTHRIAVMHRRHAEYFAAFMPLRLLPLPFPIAPVKELVQWHSLRRTDPGLYWLIDRLVDLAARGTIIDETDGSYQAKALASAMPL